MITKNIYFLVLVLVLAFFAACKNNGKHAGHDQQAEHQQKIYTCPMHPQIVRNAPGACPVCGMDLVEKKDDGAAINNDMLTLLLKPTDKFVISRVKSIHPKQMEVPVEIDASGQIGYDTREANVVSARVSGRIEKLYVKYRYQTINKGQKLMEIYSKELVTEQENYIYLLNNDSGNESLLNAAESRLSLLGFSTEQISQLKRFKKSSPTVTVYSPYAGHLHDMADASKPASGMFSGMEETTSKELIVKEGMYIESGQTVFNVYNINKVWALLTVYPEGAGMVKTGQKVVLFQEAQGNLKIEAQIDFVEPVVANETNLARVRIYLNNENKALKIGTILKAKIIAETKKGIFIPASAIVHLGSRDVVFVNKNNIFKSRVVLIGITTSQYIEIISGISKEVSIAENAQLLMDSESFIKAQDHEMAIPIDMRAQ